MALPPERKNRRNSSPAMIEPLESRRLLATVPPGFSDAPIASGLISPSSMTLAPDGRIFVAQQTGAVRVIKNGQLLPTPFTTLAVNVENERGLLGIVLDPNFSGNGFVYVYYTATTPNLHNRVSRLTASGDVAQPDSETIILDLPDLNGAINHMGGGLQFGLDGKLYVSVGNHDQTDPLPQQSPTANPFGKMMRLNPDGSIPTDNPFYNQTTGITRAVWAYGLRNPFTFAIQPGSGRMFINDVGDAAWEEINEGIVAANYGWPITEGPTNDPRFVSPFHAYPTSDGCAIVGAAFYNPANGQFPSSYVGDYFFGDLCGGWIRALDTTTGQATTFATGAPGIVDLDVAPDGSLYYLQRNGGSVRRITHAAPAIVAASFQYLTAPQRFIAQFNMNVSASLHAGDLDLFNLTTGQPVSDAMLDVSYNSDTNTATFTFPGFAAGALPDGRYRATILGQNVNNSGTFMPYDHVDEFFFLRGDANHDGIVNLIDFNILAGNFGRSGMTFANADFNYDGVVNLVDFNLLVSRFGSSV